MFPDFLNLNNSFIYFLTLNFTHSLSFILLCEFVFSINSQKAKDLDGWTSRRLIVCPSDSQSLAKTNSDQLYFPVPMQVVIVCTPGTDYQFNDSKCKITILLILKIFKQVILQPWSIMRCSKSNPSRDTILSFSWSASSYIVSSKHRT